MWRRLSEELKYRLYGKVTMDINAFLEIETKHNLFDIEIDGVQPWAYYRVELWNVQFCSEMLGLAAHFVKSGVIDTFFKNIKNILFLAGRRNKRKLQKTDILFVSHERRVKSENIFECVYTDELVKHYRDSLVLEKPFKMEHLRPLQIDNIYYNDWLIIISILYSQGHRLLNTPKYRRIYKEVCDKFEAPLSEMSEAYQYSVDKEKVYLQIVRLVFEIKILSKYYKRIIDKTNPKLIVEVVWYSRYCMLLNEFAKERNIPTIELQHGTMNSSHAAYHFSPACGEIKQFPDYLFVFSEYWKKCVDLPISDEHIKVTGYPYFERQIKKYNSKSEAGTVNIIFVSQGTIGNKLSRLAVDLCERLKDGEYKIIYKLHPEEYMGWKTRYPWLAESKIQVIDSLEHNIYEYFAGCDIQIGVYSTAIYEGMGFGLKTYIYNIGHADTMRALCDQGYAEYVNDVTDLYNHIVEKNHQALQKGDMFWQKNSFNNMCREIDLLLRDKERK